MDQESIVSKTSKGDMTVESILIVDGFVRSYFADRLGSSCMEVCRTRVKHTVQLASQPAEYGSIPPNVGASKPNIALWEAWLCSWTSRCSNVVRGIGKTDVQVVEVLDEE